MYRSVAGSVYLHLKYNLLTHWILYRIAKIIRERTAPTVTVCIEGKFGIGKTCYAVNCMLGSLVCLYYLSLKRKSSFRLYGSGESISIPRQEEILNIYPELEEVFNGLDVGNYTPLINYVRKYVAFTPFELLNIQEEALRDRRPLPFILLDDAGSFFARGGWLGFPKEWKQAISLIISNLPMIRTVTGTFILTAPTVRSILTGFVRFIDRTIIIVRLPATQYETIGDTIVKIDRGAYYHVKRYRAVGGIRGEAFTRLNKLPRPIAYPHLREAEPILEDVWKIRKEWMLHVQEKARALLARAEEEIPEGSETIRRLLYTKKGNREEKRSKTASREEVEAG